MNTYARIQNGFVAELIETNADPSMLFNPSLVWEPVNTAGAAIGWAYANGSFAPPSPAPQVSFVAPTLTQLQAELAVLQAQIAAMTATGSTGNTTPISGS